VTQPAPLTRQMLEGAFTPENLATVPEALLGGVRDPDARDVLASLGIPQQLIWFSFSDVRDGLETVSQSYDWELTDQYAQVPPGAGEWIDLAGFYYENIALDPVSGKVYGLPQDGEIFLLNSSLRQFVHFLYLVQRERPHFDIEWEGAADIDEEAARDRIEAAMRAVDPAAFEHEKSIWCDVLTYVVDPEAEFY
jgi:SUKH-4 immunity protein of toxin-antitoxin system